MYVFLGVDKSEVAVKGKVVLNPISGSKNWKKLRVIPAENVLNCASWKVPPMYIPIFCFLRMCICVNAEEIRKKEQAKRKKRMR